MHKELVCVQPALAREAAKFHPVQCEGEKSGKGFLEYLDEFAVTAEPEIVPRILVCLSYFFLLLLFFGDGFRFDDGT